MKWVVVGVLIVVLGAGSAFLLRDGESASSFSAESFVDAANEHDAGLELGEPLEFASQGQDLRTVRFEEKDHDELETSGGDDHSHGAGSLAVFDSEQAASAEYERCEATGLVCFRVANVALAFAGTVSEDEVARLTRAISAMGSG